MKIPKFLKRQSKKLRATTSRRPLRIAASANYDDMAEPNMKLSRALLIVLVLHVVAVSGIIAFNAIKTRQTPYVPSVAASTTTTSIPAATAPAKLEKQNQPVVETKPAHPPAKLINKDE